MVKIASLIAAQSGAVKLLGGDFEGSSMIIVIVTMAIVLAGGAYLYIRRRKHA
jgi:LPXTG-motif cell wall-anchored protein